MEFHDKAAFKDTLTTMFKPVDDNTFAYLLGKLDGVHEITTKLETLGHTRGTVRQFVKP